MYNYVGFLSPTPANKKINNYILYSRTQDEHTGGWESGGADTRCHLVSCSNKHWV